MRPILIAKTPRAGEFNHRYLVADSSGFEANDVLDWARRTTSRICGPDFFAVYHDVAQLRGGRTGEEGLMLVGIDTAALGEYQRVLLEQLQAVLPDLETLVTQEIDWQDYSHEGMVIACPKLNEWMSDLEQTFKQRVGIGSGLPAYAPPQIDADQKINTQVESRDSSNKLNRVFFIAVIAVIFLVLIGYFFMASDNQVESNQGQGQSGAAQAQEQLARVQAELDEYKKNLGDQEGKIGRLQDQKKLAEDKMNQAQRESDEYKTKLSQCQTKLNQSQTQVQAIKKNNESEINKIKEKINNYLCNSEDPVNDTAKFKSEFCLRTR